MFFFFFFVVNTIPSFELKKIGEIYLDILVLFFLHILCNINM